MSTHYPQGKPTAAFCTEVAIGTCRDSYLAKIAVDREVANCCPIPNVLV